MSKKNKIKNKFKRNFNKSKRRKFFRKIKSSFFNKIFFLKKEKKLFKKIILNKKVGQTPLQVLDNFRNNNKEYKDIKLAYAGRLDPLASGKLLVLVGQECKKKEKYLSLDKEYIFEILLDFSSDSKDVLGLSRFYKEKHEKTEKLILNIRENKNNFKENFFLDFNNKLKEKFLGQIELEYPIYSSKPVNGKPLFLWALENKISQIKIPTKKINIYKIDFTDYKIIDKDNMKINIFKNINSIKKVEEESKKLGNDFRREEIKKNWNNIFSEIEEETLEENNKEIKNIVNSNLKNKFLILKIKTTVSSGTYMRTLAQKIAEDILGGSGLAYSIKRTKVGKYFRKLKYFREIK